MLWAYENKTTQYKGLGIESNTTQVCFTNDPTCSQSFDFLDKINYLPLYKVYLPNSFFSFSTCCTSPLILFSKSCLSFPGACFWLFVLLKQTSGIIYELYSSLQKKMFMFKKIIFNCYSYNKYNYLFFHT